MIRLTTPLTEEQTRQLKVGDEVLLNGRVVLSRDIGHKFMKEQKPEWLKPILENMVIYHCGPVVRKNPDGTWSFVAAGPTTSIREEPYQADVIDTYKVRGVIGKGGMGKKTSDALAKVGACYLHATGGAGALLAERVAKTDAPGARARTPRLVPRPQEAQGRAADGTRCAAACGTGPACDVAGYDADPGASRANARTGGTSQAGRPVPRSQAGRTVRDSGVSASSDELTRTSVSFCDCEGRCDSAALLLSINTQDRHLGPAIGSAIRSRIIGSVSVFLVPDE